MFGCVVAGRLLQTNLQHIDETHAIFELPSASTINHICVFLLGTSASMIPILSCCRLARTFVSTFPRWIWGNRSLSLAGEGLPVAWSVR